MSQHEKPPTDKQISEASRTIERAIRYLENQYQSHEVQDQIRDMKRSQSVLFALRSTRRK